ncbi:hypothetical protein E4U19_007271 [Claviceps sp. Clav32 group G5]|nr:hypothetical protein E4U40_007211 [Claviceps sp. LM458 group G5]KAG6032696.1 hypothetical protein E4U19_007271 [Claviceps sp. Clav32 group G5]KAG6048136.1 hypothetical protein E4U39_007674 [Claviceps sp. Clav50 group G5]
MGSTFFFVSLATMAWSGAVATPHYLSEPSPTPTTPGGGEGVLAAQGYPPTSHSHSHTPSDSDCTSSTTAPPPWPTPEPTGPLCTLTNTITSLDGRDQGCDFEPGNQRCFADAILTLPCGCARGTVLRTTETQCPTANGETICMTNYMYTTTATNCPTTSL